MARRILQLCENQSTKKCTDDSVKLPDVLADFPTNQFALWFTKTDKLGCGSFGSVSSVRSIGGAASRQFACKRFDGSSSTTLDSFVKEVEILATIQSRVGPSPHVVPMLMSFCEIETEGKLRKIVGYMLMPQMEQTLRRRVQGRRHNLDRESAYCEMRQIAKGLAHIHALNIVHMDLKQDNVLVNNGASSADCNVVLADFGSSYLCTAARPRLLNGSDSHFMESGVVEVTVTHRPLDLFFGNAVVTTATDLWSFGVVAYFALTCKELFWDRKRGSSDDEVVDAIMRMAVFSEHDVNVYAEFPRASELIAGLKSGVLDSTVQSFLDVPLAGAMTVEDREIVQDLMRMNPVDRRMNPL